MMMMIIDADDDNDDDDDGVVAVVNLVAVYNGSNKINLFHRHGYHARITKERCRGQHGTTVDENKRHWQSRTVTSLATH